MPRFAASTSTACCPFIDTDDPQCESHFSIGRLSEAFGDCFGDYHRCPNYARLAAHQRAEAFQPALETFAQLTRHGRRLHFTGA